MHRLHRAVVPVLAPILGAGLVVLPTATSEAAGGPVGGRVTLDQNAAFSGYDAVTTSDGTTYVGWISNSYDDTTLRQVHLCVLHPTSTSCVGGVQTTGPLAPSTAQDLHVVVAGGQVELVWDAQVTLGAGEFSGVFGVAKVTGGKLGAATSIAGAPSYPTMTSVIVTASGDVSAAVIGSGDYNHKVYYYKSLTASPTTLTRPYFIGNAQLADNGKQTVLTTSPYGQITEPVAVAHKSSAATSWSAFSNVAGSNQLSGIERLAEANGRIWLLAGRANTFYPGYTFAWTGSSFAGARATGDPRDVWSFDATTDASGRLATVSTEVGQLAISNFGTGQRAAEFTIPVKQTFAGGTPQLTTSPSGQGWVIYSVQTAASTGNLLFAQRIRLSGLTQTVRRHGAAGKVTLTGPATCMPATPVSIKIKGKAAHGWRAASKRMRLGSKKVKGSIDGASLTPNHRYTLIGSVKFRNGSRHQKVTARLSFTTCARP